ncbi:MAG: CAP domain-containing protein [Blastocatellia bacterium]
MRSVSLFLFALIILFTADATAQKRSVKPQPILVDEIGESGSSRTFSRPRITTSKASGAIRSAYEVERQAFDLLNARRASVGLAPLVWDNKIAKVARLHSRNMAEHGFFSHQGADGTMVDDRADMLGLGSWQAIGENIAFLKGFDNPSEAAVEKWMQSTSHRRNALASNWRESAVGVAVTGDGTYYFTQVFLLRR